MKNILIKAFIALVLSMLVILAFARGAFEKAELAFYDWRLKNSYVPTPLPPPFAVIGITEDFEEKTGERFSRSHHARLIEILNEEQVTAIAFDIFFPQITDEEIDRAFIKSISTANNIILPVFSPVRLQDRDGIAYEAPAIRGSDARFHAAALSLGQINTLPDDDQVVRRVPVFIRHEHTMYPQIALELARVHHGKQSVMEIISGSRALPATGSIPVRQDGTIYVKIPPAEQITRHFIPFSDVLIGNYPKGWFRNKAIIVGQTIVGAKNADLVPTPRGTQFGVLLQTAVLHNALTGKHIYRLSSSSIIYLLALWGLVMGMTIFSSNTIFNSFWMLSITALLALFPAYAMKSRGLFFDAVPFFTVSFLCYLCSLFYSLATAVKKVFQKETSLKTLQNVEKEITRLLNPSELPGITKGIAISGFEEDSLVKQTPEITIKTLLASLGIEIGLFVASSGQKQHRVIAQSRNTLSQQDIKQFTDTCIQNNQSILINHPPAGMDRHIKNLLVLPVISHPTFTITGIFANKHPTAFSRIPGFHKDDIPIISSLSLQSIISIQNAELNLALKNTQLESIFRLSVALEYRDRETGMHIHRVSEFAALIAKNIGLPNSEKQLIKSAMPLHDIGKIGIPDNILLKPGHLTPEERKIIEQHPVIGGKMLEGSNSLILKASEIIALYHHEKYDGSGYPFGLKGTGIPLYGRIASIADVFDAMASARVYKEALTLQNSLNFLHENAGIIFDPKMVDAFIREEPAIKTICATYADEPKT